MKLLVNRLKEMKRDNIILAVAVLVCIVCGSCFLCYYFRSYQKPYMVNGIIDISENWQYETGHSGLKTIENLRTGPKLRGGETLTLYKILDTEMREPAVMIRANHQYISAYLDDTPLLEAGDEAASSRNPGMSLHFIPLQADYSGKTLKIEITSPYALYSGRTSPILMGTVQSLETYAVSHSMRSVILMSMCLLMGVFTVVLTGIQAIKGYAWPKDLALGIFAVIWALYYVCTEYIAFLFFTPLQMSFLSLGLYFSFEVPLTLFLYFSFREFKKWMLSAVILPITFVLAAFALHLSGLAELPNLVNINNFLLAGLAYSIVLCMLEALKGNRFIMLVVPFLIIAYISMLYNFAVFYTRRGVVPYSYRDTYLMLILVVLIYNIQQFFSKYYQQIRESDALSLQNRLAQESYNNIKSNLQELESIKHEVKNHIAALRTYLKDERYSEAHDYLEQYSKKTETVLEITFHDNFLINAIIGDLTRKAYKNGIKVELNLKASPNHIADPDLYSLLTNILENAVEACAAVPEKEERFIRLTMLRREPYFSIICENSRTGEIIRKDERICTTKPGGRHGYGLRTIEHIIEAYDGMMDVCYDERTFTIAVAIKDMFS